VNKFIYKPVGYRSHAKGICRYTGVFFRIIVIGIIVLTVFLNYASSTSRQMESRQDSKMIVSAVADTYFTRVDSSEITGYKLEAEQKLKENELYIAELKDRLIVRQVSLSTSYVQQLDSLSVLNTRLRNKIEIYNPESRLKWETFKIHFTGELNAIGRNINLLDERI